MKKEKRYTDTHLKGWSICSMCVTMEILQCLGGAYTPQGMNGCKAETEKREKGRPLALSQNW